jgi:hypothetical protein
VHERGRRARTHGRAVVRPMAAVRSTNRQLLAAAAAVSAPIKRRSTGAFPSGSVTTRVNRIGAARRPRTPRRRRIHGPGISAVLPVSSSAEMLLARAGLDPMKNHSITLRVNDACGCCTVGVPHASACTQRCVAGVGTCRR